MSNLNVVPFDETTVKTVYSITINVNNVVLFQSAVITVVYYDVNNSFISLQSLELAGENYTNWGSNDDYILNYVSTALNITILSNESGKILVQTTQPAAPPVVEEPVVEEPVVEEPVVEEPVVEEPVVEEPVVEPPVVEEPVVEEPVVEPSEQV